MVFSFSADSERALWPLAATIVISLWPVNAQSSRPYGYQNGRFALWVVKNVLNSPKCGVAAEIASITSLITDWTPSLISFGRQEGKRFGWLYQDVARTRRPRSPRLQEISGSEELAFRQTCMLQGPVNFIGSLKLSYNYIAAWATTQDQKF